MRAGESFRWSNLAAGTYDLSNCAHPGVAPFPTGPIVLDGGTYQIGIHCTGTPALTFKQLGPDGSTFEAVYMQPDSAPGTPILTIASSGLFAKVTIPPGAYHIVVGTSTANYVALTRIPMSE